MSENEIKDMEQEVDSNMEEMAQNPMAAGGMPGMPGAGGMPPPGGEAPPSEEGAPPEEGGGQPPQQDNGPESRENIPPTQKEEARKLLNKLRTVALLEGNRSKIKTMDRIISKFKKTHP